MRGLIGEEIGEIVKNKAIQELENILDTVLKEMESH